MTPPPSLKTSPSDLRYLYEALTRYNYFPNQKEKIGEIPPCINTRRFTPEICESLATLKASKERINIGGYDLVEFKATRYNNVPRTLSLIHPMPYSLLVKHIHDSWDHLSYIKNSECSKIIPEHHLDGRLLVMNYGNELKKKSDYYQNSFACRFKAHADIANCFNSIYTHAIPWAVTTMEGSKRQKDKNSWYDKLDTYQRRTKRNETQGVPIGPATSNIIVEVILQKIDQLLSKDGFKFERYIDDYTSYCETEDRAQQFIICLGKALDKYKLHLNVRKTKITELPAPCDESWILELKSSIPVNKMSGEDGISIIDTSDAMTFLNKAILINKNTPDGSILKYAIQSIINKIDDYSCTHIIKLIINLSWHYPILIPFLDELIERSECEIDAYTDDLESIIMENCLKNRSDGIAWPLHIMRKHNQPPSEKLIASVVNSNDCISITILFSMAKESHLILKHVENICSQSMHVMDESWILLYQVYLSGKIENPYDDKVFSVLKSHDVDFLPSDVKTASEIRCDTVNIELMFTDAVPA